MSGRRDGNPPAFCTERNCQCIANVGAQDIQRGGSVICCGRILNPGAVQFTATGPEGYTTHKNDMHLCWYTPLKGWIKFCVNAGDLDAIAWVGGNVMRAAGKIEDWVRTVGREQVLNDSALGTRPVQWHHPDPGNTTMNAPPKPVP